MVLKEEITQAGEEAIICVYGGHPSDENLDKLRFRRFCENVLTSISPVQVHTLPTTAGAAHHHGARVYNQVHE